MAVLRRPCESAGETVRAPVQTSGAATWVLIVAIAGSSMTFIDANAVSVALPAMQRELNADAADLQWVVEGYALFLSALILIGGSLGDIFGRRRIFVAGIVLFALASLACAASRSVLVLDIARCVQGVGGALATPGSLALISSNFSDSDRGRAIGTWSGFAAITAALGPLLGGWLAQHASWRYVFLINVPLAVFVVIAAFARVPESRDEAAKRSIDVTGALLVTSALAALTFGLIRLQVAGTDLAGAIAAGSGVLLLGAFVFCEARESAPMVPLAIFRNATFSGANVYTFFLYAALGGSLYFVPFDLQNIQGYSPTAAGAAMLPFIIIMFALSRWSGSLVATTGARVPLIVGAVVAAVGFLAYARAAAGGSYWTTFFPASVILGFGGALFVAPLTTTVMEAGDAKHAGLASGINNAVSRVAGLLAIAALGIVLLASFYGEFDRVVPALHVSVRTQQLLARDREALGTGKPLEALAEPDRTAVNDLLRRSYTLGFERVMAISAAFALLAALVVVPTVPSRVRSRVNR